MEHPVSGSWDHLHAVAAFTPPASRPLSTARQCERASRPSARPAPPSAAPPARSQAPIGCRTCITPFGPVYLLLLSMCHDAMPSGSRMPQNTRPSSMSGASLESLVNSHVGSATPTSMA